MKFYMVCLERTKENFMLLGQINVVLYLRASTNFCPLFAYLLIHLKTFYLKHLHALPLRNSKFLADRLIRRHNSLSDVIEIRLIVLKLNIRFRQNSVEITSINRHSTVTLCHIKHVALGISRKICLACGHVTRDILHLKESEKRLYIN